jgi:hypothetical protein
MKIEQVSLFDVEDVETMPKVRDMTVGPVSMADLREFAKRYHYTGGHGVANWRWGLWHGPVLHGVVGYNAPTRSVCESVFGPEHHHRVWHMSRLMLSELSPRNSESRLIGGSLRAMTHQYPETWAVLTYADFSVGHIGIVYQATNALYTGTGGDSTYYIDQDGKRRGTYINVNGVNVTRKYVAQFGWTKHTGEPKHRYVYILGNKTQRRQRRKLLKLPVLPYPKGAA